MAVDIAEQVPAMSDVQLKTFRDNVMRLQTTGTDRQKTEAERLLPVILAELAGRKPEPAAPRKAAAPRKKAAAPKKAKAKADAED